MPVSKLTGIIAVSAGNAHSLALKSDGTVWAWGIDSYGLLLGKETYVNFPVQVSGLMRVKAIAAGGAHSLALKSDGTVWAWGDNGLGQLGIHSQRYGSQIYGSQTPLQVSGLGGVIAIAAGGFQSLALKADGTVWGWGNGYYRCQQASWTPVRLNELSGITAIASGGYNLAQKSDGTVWAWGMCHVSGNEFEPVSNPFLLRVRGLSNVTAIAVGREHGLALKADGTVWAWGSNTSGQLGTTAVEISSNTTVRVSVLGRVNAIAAGSEHNLALRADGTVSVWGNNTSGQLGINSLQSRTVPVDVGGLTGVVAISGGDKHSLAIGAAEFTPSRTLPCYLSATLFYARSFVVRGTCTFPTPGFSVELRPHFPQGPDYPRILLLDAVIQAPTSPVPQVPTDVQVLYDLPGSPPPPPIPAPHPGVERVIILPDYLVLTVAVVQ